jgi:hypothetical protein
MFISGRWVQLWPDKDETSNNDTDTSATADNCAGTTKNN